MTNLKSQSGRSMVEMLGVLAIIGVLSIGGIAGYTMAMNRYKANELLAIAAQVAVIGQTANMGEGKDQTNADVGVATLKGATQIKYTKSDDTIAIYSVESGIATAINSIVGDTPCKETTEAGGTTVTTCSLKMADGRLSAS